MKYRGLKNYRYALAAAVLMCVVHLSQSQNAYFVKELRFNPDKTLGLNPKNLNEEMDHSSEGQGWNLLKWDTLTVGYTAIDSLPFDFGIKGAKYRFFRASANGILTFTTTGLAKANYAISNISDPRIPSNSIVLGGVMARGNNDRVLVKSFGIAPHRQFWLKFHSFSMAADTANKFATYSYNSIVLEEGSGEVHIVRMSSGSELNNQSTLPFKFKQANGIHLGPFEYYDQASIADSFNVVSQLNKSVTDNSFITFAPGIASSADGEISVTPSPQPSLIKYVKVGSSTILPVVGRITAIGISSVLDYDLMVQVNQETPLQITNLNWVKDDYKSGHFSVEIKRSTTAGERLKIKAWILPKAGLLDNNKNNDTLPLIPEFVVQNQNIDKSNMLFEYYSATWCNQCPAASDVIDSLKVKYPKVLFVAHHVNDQMHSKLAPFSPDSLPFATINRVPLKDQNPKQYSSQIANFTSTIGSEELAKVSVENLKYDADTRKITGDVVGKATNFLSKRNLRLGVMLKEKDVRGLGSGWDQRVDVRLTLDSPSVFYKKNKTLVGYHHNDVVWSADGGSQGLLIGITNDDVMAPNATVRFAFSLNIPDSIIYLGMPTAADYGPTGSIKARYKPADLSVVGFMSDDVIGLRENSLVPRLMAGVLNSVEQKIWDVSNSVAEIISNQGVLLYPNPSDDFVLVRTVDAIVSVEVFDLAGRAIFLLENPLPVFGLNDLESKNNIQLIIQNFPNGCYIIQAKTPKGIGIARLIVQH